MSQNRQIIQRAEYL